MIQSIEINLIDATIPLFEYQGVHYSLHDPDFMENIARKLPPIVHRPGAVGYKSTIEKQVPAKCGDVTKWDIKQWIASHEDEWVTEDE